MSHRPFLARLLDNWEQQIFRPIVVTVLTTCVLLLGSLIFKPIRSFLFPPEAMPDYPLYCTAEAYVRRGESPPTLGVDFFIINRTGEEYERKDLQSFLRSHRPDEPTLSPDIRLTYNRSVGKVVQAAPDRQFNEDKGDVRVTLESTRIRIVPEHVAPRAVLRVSMVVGDLPALENVTRGTRNAVPFDDLDTYQRGCYSR